jgi:acyl transferase domain-containing protein
VATARLTEHFRQHLELPPADVAYTLQLGRRRFSHRRYLVCRSLDEAATALDGVNAKRAVTGAEEARERRWNRDLAAANLEGLDPKRVVTGVEEARARPVAFMFPGQGAQYVNMGRELYESEPAFREPLDRCAEILTPHLGRDLRRLIYPEKAEETAASEELRQTSLTQPALFVVEYALSQLWMSWGIKPAAMIGHSIGEYVAACLAGVFRLEDALKLVAQRGRLMQQLPAGAMLSVRLPATEVEALLDGSGVEVAALNEEKATVVSGTIEAVMRLEARLGSQGVAFQRLHTSHAFHSAMMDPILETFRAQVAQVDRRAPQIPYVSNLTGTWVTEAEATDPAYWSRHLRETVRFAHGLKELMKEPERVLLEVGPGRVLSGLAIWQTNRSRHNVVVSSIRHPQESDSDVAFLLGALGRLWLAGVDVAWKSFHSRGARRRVPLPTYPFERQRFWVEPGAPAAGDARRKRDEKQPEIADWFYLPSWRRSPPPDLDGVKRGPWLVFAESSGLGERIVRRLAQAGEEVVSVVAADGFAQRAGGTFELNPAEPRDYVKLIETLEGQGRSPLSIAHFWGLQEGSAGAPQGGRRVQDLGFFSLLHLARALDGRGPDVRREIVVVTRGVQDVTGEETLSPDHATVLGPCKVIPQEYAALGCRNVDVVGPGPAGWDEESVGQVLAELASGSDDRIVAYRRRRRWIPSFDPCPLAATPDRPRRLREGGVYLVNGGLGGIGLGAAELLARTAKAKLVLVGRGALPPRAEWERWLQANGDGNEVGQRLRKLLALEELGAEVLAVQADVSNVEQLRKALAEAESRFGGVHGVIHAAGVERAFQSIAETAPADAEAQFRPRLGGVAALEQALEGRPLDFCLLISSLSSVLGGLGSVSYTAAHVFLDVFAARHNRASATPWLSVNWDRWFTWRDTTQEPAAGEVGFFMTPAEAQEALHRVLNSRALTHLVVSTGDLQGRIDRWVRLIVPEEPKPSEAPAASLYARPEIGEDYVAPSTPEEETLAGIWCQALGVEKVGVNDDFFELGGDSVLGLRIVAKANEAGLRMTGRHVFEHHTIAELARALAGSTPPATAAAAPTPATGEPATAFPGARLDPKDLEAFLAGLGGSGSTPPK